MDSDVAKYEKIPDRPISLIRYFAIATFIVRRNLHTISL